MLRDWNASCSHVAACHWGMNYAKSWLLCANDADIASLASWCTCHQKHPSFAGLRTSTGSYVSSQTAEYPQALADYDKEMLSLPRLSHRRALSHLSQLDSESSPRYFWATSWIALALWTRTRTRLQGVESSPSSAVRCSSVRRWPQSNETDCQQLDAHPWKNSLLVNSPRATISARCFATIGSTCQRPRCGSTSPSSKWRPHGGIRTYPSWAYMAIKTIKEPTAVFWLHWAGADEDPDLTWSLLQAELDEGWIEEIPGGMVEAMGKLNVVQAPAASLVWSWIPLFAKWTKIVSYRRLWCFRQLTM